MILEVDTNFLIRNNLTIKEHLFLYFLYKNNINTISKYLKFDPIDETFIRKLIKEEWITGNITDIKLLKITKKYSSLFENRDYFEEFLDTYPTSVTRNDGTKSYLRTAQKECKMRYNRIIKNSRIKHDSIINALKNEINIKTNNNQLMWFKTMPNWLKSEEWKQYENITEDVGHNEINSYGTNIL